MLPEVELNIESEVIVARKDSKFKCEWSYDPNPLDLFPCQEAIDKLTDLLGKEIAAEIDREILEDLRRLSSGEVEIDKEAKINKKPTHRTIFDDWEASCDL